MEKLFRNHFGFLVTVSIIVFGSYLIADSDALETKNVSYFGNLSYVLYQNESDVIFIQSSSIDTMPFYRAYGNHDHFYTMDKQEYDNSPAFGYAKEGICCYILNQQVSYDGQQAIPLYRSYHAQHDHFYTTSKQEWDSAVAYGYAKEGIAGYVFSTQVKDSFPLYRSYSGAQHDHFYTTSKQEWDSAVAYGYAKEGIAGYVFLDKLTLSLGTQTTNTSPVANAGPDQTVIEGDQVTLYGGSSFDPERDALTYLWVPNDSSIKLNANNVPQPTFTAPTVSSSTNYKIALTVTDTGGLSDSDDVVITVNPARPPPSLLDSIAFTAGFDVWLLEKDGTIRNIQSGSASDHSPTWFPDGKTILFTSYPDVGSDQPSFKVIDPSTMQTKVLISSIPKNTVSPSISPDGNKIVFTANPDRTKAQIYTINVDGSELKRLTFTSSNISNPQWSPDGNKILFSADGIIYKMNSDGSNITKLSRDSLNNQTPQWSSDGNKIVFSKGYSDDTEIYIMDSNGANQRKVTDNSVSDAYPTWSPDGNHIAYSKLDRQNPARSGIYLINTDGTGEVFVGSGGGHATDLEYNSPQQTSATSTSPLFGQLAPPSIESENEDLSQSYTLADLRTDKNSYVIGTDAIITLIEPDYDLNSGLDLVNADNIEVLYGGEKTTILNNIFSASDEWLTETNDRSGIFQIIVKIPSKIGSLDLKNGDTITFQFRDKTTPNLSSQIVSTSVDVVSLTHDTTGFATVKTDKSTYFVGTDMVVTLEAPYLNSSDMVDKVSLDKIWLETKGQVWTNLRNPELNAQTTELIETGKNTGIFQTVITMPRQIGSHIIQDSQHFSLLLVDSKQPNNIQPIKADFTLRVFGGSTPSQSDDRIAPKILTRDIVKTAEKVNFNKGTTVNFENNVKAIDDKDGVIDVVCEPKTGSFFRVGTHKVSCTAMDSAGNIARESFNVTIVTQETKVPTWIKNMGQWYCSGEIDEKSFIEGIQYLVNSNILSVDNTVSSSQSSQSIPNWVKSNICWWSENKINDKDFLSGIGFLINNGIIDIRNS